MVGEAEASTTSKTPAYLQLTRTEHVVQDCEAVRTLRRKYNVDELMSYWHLVQKVWVIGVWLQKERGWIKELAILGESPNLGRHTCAKIEARLFGSNAEVLALIRRFQGDHKQSLIQANQEWKDRRRYLRRKGYDDVFPGPLVGGRRAG